MISLTLINSQTHTHTHRYVLALQGMLLLLDGTLQSFLLTPLLLVILLVYYYIRSSYGSLIKYLAMSSNMRGGSTKSRSRTNIGSINKSTLTKKKDEEEEEEDDDEIDPETPLLGAKRYPSVFLDDPSIAFRAYASEFGGSMGSLSTSNIRDNTNSKDV